MGGNILGGAMDHPRSRGVYPKPFLATKTSAGSSPLARGLLQVVHREHDPGGIIPARAGFTRRTTGVPTTRKDHPRSRGVYYNEIGLESVDMGSSPLARGLRCWRGGRSTERGIIPARAGFTWPSAGGVQSSSDHPRSRGVYEWGHGFARAGLGSSPLARGLLHGPSGALRARRIIPARAGFTLTAARRRGMTSDHPRSRGVYVSLRSWSCLLGGSSPLARGLLVGFCEVIAGEGIIPARAGFT